MKLKRAHCPGALGQLAGSTPMCWTSIPSGTSSFNLGLVKDMLYVILPIWLGPKSYSDPISLEDWNLPLIRSSQFNHTGVSRLSKEGNSHFLVFFFLQLRPLLCPSFPSSKDKLMLLWSPWTEPDSSFFHYESWVCCSSPRRVCWPSSLLLKG